MPKISIVIPVYNGERYLSKAISSVLDQTFHDFELILVNDCSTDSTPAIMESFAARDNRVKILANATNQKLPKSLNIGFENANGSFFTWLSDDNALLPYCLEKLHNAMIASDCDIIYGNSIEVDENDNFLLLKERLSPVSNLCFENTVGACFLYKAAVHKKNSGFKTDLFLLEDYDFWLRAWLNGFKFAHLDDAPYIYRRHAKSLSSKFIQQVSFRKLNYHLKMRRAFEKNKALLSLVDEEIRRLRNNFYFADSVLPSSCLPAESGEPFNLRCHADAIAGLIEKKDFPGAKRLLDDVLRLLPDWPDAYILYSFYYEAQGETALALQAQARAARLDGRKDILERLKKLKSIVPK